MSAARLAADGYLLLAVYGVWLSTVRAGLPILGGGAFVAIGGYGVALLGPGGSGLPLALSVVVAVVIASASGWLLGYGSARLDGSRLALATWGLAWLVTSVLRGFPSWSGGSEGLTRRAPVHLISRWLGLDFAVSALGHLVIAGVLVALTVGCLARVLSGPAGADLSALAEGPTVASALGVPVAARRRAVLAASAALAALSGAGGLALQGVVAPGDVSPLLSVQLLAAVLIGGRRLWGPWVGIVALAGLPELAARIADASGRPRGQIDGVVTAALLLVALAVRQRIDSRRGVPRPTVAHSGATSSGAAGRPASPVASAPAPSTVADHQPLLVATGLSASYGSLRVLEDIDLEIRPGQVHALLGPNGSGKTTLLRLLAGATKPEAGTIVVNGVNLTNRTEVSRVRAGVARSFQRTVILAGLSPREQVAVGARVATARPFAVLRHLIAAPTAARDAASRAMRTGASLAAVGLAEDPPALLVTADQRLLQVARVVATGARVLLLDEPGAGMTAVERESLAAVLRGLAAAGLGVLLVEHDVPLVAAVADWVTVLAAGRVIARGPMAQVREEPQVVAAYLGLSALTGPGE